MERIRVGQVDLSTGELLEDATLAVFYPKRRNGFPGGWVAMAQDPMLALARADLGKEAMRVLFAILAKLDFENYLALSHADLAKLLEMKRPSVSRAIARLIEEGVMLAGPRVGNRATYRLNPSYGWKGSAKGHHEALRERMKARGMSIVGDDEPRDELTGDLFEGRK